MKWGSGVSLHVAARVRYVSGRPTEARIRSQSSKSNRIVVENFSKLGLALFVFLIPEVSVRAESTPCQSVTYEHSEYTVCEVAYDDSPSGCSGKSRTGTLTNIFPHYRVRLVTTRGTSFLRQMVACTTQTIPRSACTSRRVGSWCVPTRAPAPVTST